MSGETMSNNENENKGSKQTAEQADKNALEKAPFGSLTPLTAAQIVTLLVGTTSVNSTYGGY
jgi:hypothetical protein